MKTLLRFFFRLLYHELAFTYDLVAATVSFNRWKDWVLSVLPFLAGQHILEIGHGPGHLQSALLRRGLLSVGIDESVQMGRLAQRNLRRSSASHASPPAYAQGNLTRGLAQQLPFANASFDTVVATFPAEYIYDPKTLAETGRVLVDGGRFIVLPGAMITGRGTLDRFLAWIFRITGETPPNLAEILQERPRKAFAQAGFRLETHEVAVKSSLVFIMLGTKIQITEEREHAAKTT